MHVHGFPPAGVMPHEQREDAFPQDGRPTHVVPAAFFASATSSQPLNGPLPDGFDPADGLPAAAWSAWKLVVQAWCVAAAGAVALLGPRHVPAAAVALGGGFLLVAHFSCVDGFRFLRRARAGSWSTDFGSGAGPMVPFGGDGVVACRVVMPSGSMTGAAPTAPQRVSVVPPSGMPIAARWAFVDSIGDHAPGSSSSRSASSMRNSTSSGRLR